MKFPHYAVLLLLFLLLFELSPANAQITDDTPTIRFHTTENLFPVGVFFRLNGTVPEGQSLQSIRLEIRLASDALSLFNRAIPMSDEQVVQQQGTRFNVLYVLEDASLPLFVPLTYEWVVTSSSGASVRDDGMLVFADQRVEWDVFPAGEGVPLTVVIPQTPSGTEAEWVPERVRRLLAAPLALLIENTGFSPAPVNLVVYPEGSEPGCPLSGPDGAFVVLELEAVGDAGGRVIRRACDPSLAFERYSAGGYILVQGSASNTTLINRALKAFFEQAYGPVWDDAEVPQWFQLGLLQLYLGGQNAVFLPPVQVAARNNRLLSLDAMSKPPAPDDPAFPLFEAQSYGWVVYMAERYGLPTLFEFASTVGDAEDFAAAFEASTGETLPVFARAWSLWIFTDAAPLSYNVDLYGLPTSTPTTAILPATLPPTSTLPPPPSDTPTVTPTATGPTPLPTRTVTPIPPTRTPSLTPRPASSVFTPTPSPTPSLMETVQTALDPQTLRWVFFGMMSVGVLLIVVALLWTGRREQ